MKINFKYTRNSFLVFYLFIRIFKSAFRVNRLLYAVSIHNQFWPNFHIHMLLSSISKTPPYVPPSPLLTLSIWGVIISTFTLHVFILPVPPVRPLSPTSTGPFLVSCRLFTLTPSWNAHLEKLKAWDLHRRGRVSSPIYYFHFHSFSYKSYNFFFLYGRRSDWHTRPTFSLSIRR